MKYTVSLKKVLGILAGGMAVATLVVPLAFGFKAGWLVQFGYVGLFVVNYFGFGVWLLPVVLQELNPVAVVLITAFGVSIDEFFAWYAGKSSEHFEAKHPWHAKLHLFVEKYGLKATFVLGLLPLSGIVYAVSGFAAGHFGIPFYKFFFVNFSGKLIRTIILVAIILKIQN